RLAPAVSAAPSGPPDAAARAAAVASRARADVAARAAAPERAAPAAAASSECGGARVPSARPSGATRRSPPARSTRPETPAATTAPWSAPTVMRPADDNGNRDPAVAIAGNGNAFVAWVQADGSGSPYWNSIWMRQYTAGSGAGWNAAGLFEGYNDQGAYDVNV